MIIQLNQKIAESQKNAIVKRLESMQYKANEVRTQMGVYLVAIGKTLFDIREIGQMPGIEDIHIVSDHYKLVSRKWKVNPTVLDLGGDVRIGEGQFTIMAGPCSIEGEENIRQTLAHLSKNNIRIMRGGVFKPRSSPYSFRGLGFDGLKSWHDIARKAGVRIISEVMQVSQIEPMYDYVDIYQVGARNTQNFNLLDELGKVDKPVMIKRGISGTIDELLYSAEYVFSGGNEKLILCERGIRTYETASRNTLDLNAIPILKEKTHLPVIADPSHGIGIREFVEPMALASVMAGADGVMLEIHPDPEKAFSDGQQTVHFPEAEIMYDRLRKAFELKSTF
jgi:3-deoxy-7-phosphoheptulonate synthase